MLMACAGCGHHRHKKQKEFVSKFNPSAPFHFEELSEEQIKTPSAKEEIEKAFSPIPDELILPGSREEEKKTEGSWFFWNG